MSIKISFPQKPTEAELEQLQKAADKFFRIVNGSQFQAIEAVAKAKTTIDIIACKYCAQYRHNEVMKAIRFRERAIKKGGKE